MKIEIKEYVAHPHALSAEATETRNFLSTLVYDADESLLTDAEMDTAIESGKIAARSCLDSYGEVAFQHYLNKANSTIENHFSSDSGWTPEPIALASMFMQEYARHCGATYVDRMCMGTNYLNVKEVNLQLGKIIGAYQALCSWIRKQFHLHNFTPDMKRQAVSFISYMMSFPSYTSSTQDRIIETLIPVNSRTVYMCDIKERLPEYIQNLRIPGIRCSRIDTNEYSMPEKNSQHPSYYLHQFIYKTESGVYFFGHLNFDAMLKFNTVQLPLGKAMAALAVDNELIKSTLIRLTTPENVSNRLVIYPNDTRFCFPYMEAHNTGSICSCMSKEAFCYDSGTDAWGDEYHPLDAYSLAYFSGLDNSLALFTLVNGDGNIISRSIVNVAKKTYVRMYGDHKLCLILNQLGISEDSDTLDGVALACLHTYYRGRVESDALVGPYLDGGHDYVRIGNVEGHEDTDVLWVDDNGDIYFCDTAGVYNRGERFTCEWCEESLTEDDALFVSYEGVYLCEDCFYEHTAECAITGERAFTQHMAEIQLDGEWAWILDSKRGDLYYVPSTNMYYRDIDDLIELYNGDLAHCDDVVQLADETYCLESEYDADVHGLRYGEKADGDEEEEAA